MTEWPHAPPHRLLEQGIYMVTAGTYNKIHHFKNPERLQLLLDSLLKLAQEYNWILHAWAVLSNHYHFIAQSPEDPSNLRKWIAILHQRTASAINSMDNTPNRKVWYQFWDSRITIHSSYLARLNYVHRNPVKHGIVSEANQYPWCSAQAFENNSQRSFVKTIYSFDYGKVKVYDDF